MSSNKNLNEVFKIFQTKESFFTKIDEKHTNKFIFKQIAVICLFSFIYGISMGSYHSLLQAIASGLKVAVLFISSILICFPSFFIIQQALGSKLKFKEMIIIILSGITLSSAITLSFVPIIIFFLITGSNYHFLQLLHVSIFIFAGIFGMKLIIDALKYACEKKNIYPQIGVTIFKVWIIIFAFVGIQLAWNLRPFLGDKEDGFILFRKYEGNFYTAIIYSFEQLISKNDRYNNQDDIFEIDTNSNQQIDTTKLIEIIDENYE